MSEALVDCMSSGPGRRGETLVVNEQPGREWRSESRRAGLWQVVCFGFFFFPLTPCPSDLPVMYTLDTICNHVVSRWERLALGITCQVE